MLELSKRSMQGGWSFWHS